MKTNDFDSMDIDELWSLHEHVTSTLARKIAKEKSKLEERLRNQAEADREKAKSLPPCREREDLLLRARRADTASHLTEWLNSPGLQPPK